MLTLIMDSSFTGLTRPRQWLGRAEPREQCFGEFCAAGILEWKNVREGRAEFGFELLAHEFFGAVKTGLHRLFPKTEGGGRLLHAELLDHAHHEHDPEGLGQIVDRMLQQGAALGSAPRSSPDRPWTRSPETRTRPALARGHRSCPT